MTSVAIGRDVQQCYEAIIAGDKSVSWGVFNYEGQTELRVQNSGADDLSEFPDEFSDGKLQYAFLRIAEPNSKLPKFVLVGWCGDGAPRKGVFQQHFSSVAAKLTGYHVQITARDEEDVSERSILKKVEDASGAKYSISNSSSLFGPTTSKKPTTNSLVNQLKGQNAPSFNPRKPTLTEPRLPSSASVKPSAPRTSSYAKRTEDWDIPKTDTHGKVHTEESTPVSDAPSSEPVKSSYQPIGRPDINALRAEAQPENPSLSSQGTGTAYKPVEIPKTGSLADRMAAFSGNNKSENSTPAPRKSSNPLASRFGASIGGTKPAVPSSGVRESKAIGGLAKNFGSEGGKTPAQQWAERKARERGESIPEPVAEAPVKATTYDNDDSRTSTHANVSSMRNRFAASSLEDEPVSSKATSLPPPPPTQVSARQDTPEPESEEEQEAELEQQRSTLPPPPNMSSRPVAATINHPPPAPVVHQHEEEEEEEHNVATPTRHERSPSPEPESEPEPEPVRNNFKAQLEQKLGGGGAVAAAPIISGTDSQPHVSHASVEASSPSARALYEYEAGEENEIGFEEGEVIHDIEMVDEGWWSGKNAAGQSGLFPSNYVELIEDNGGESAPVRTQTQAHEPAAPASTHKGSGQCATAIYGYEVAEEGEVGFEEGEMIEEIQQIDEGWWQGKNARGEQGLFPANYVELID